MLGGRPLILWGPHVKEIVAGSVEKSIQEAGMEMVDVVFQGEATTEERARVGQIAREARADVTVGIGGGKVLDVAKAVAVDAETKMVSCHSLATAVSRNRLTTKRSRVGPQQKATSSRTPCSPWPMQ